MIHLEQFLRCNHMYGHFIVCNKLSFAFNIWGIVVARILLIEDDIKLQRVYQHFLEEKGYEVLTTRSCWIALQLMEKNPVDVLITDIMVQDFDGIELIRILRIMPNPPPIIAMTGSTKQMSGMGLLAIARSLGVQQTLQKPFTRMELLQSVDALLNGVAQA